MTNGVTTALCVTLEKHIPLWDYPVRTTGIPVLFGVITTENIEQAIARAGSKAGNKGYDCALSAIEMVNLMKQF